MKARRSIIDVGRDVMDGVFLLHISKYSGSQLKYGEGR